MAMDNLNELWSLSAEMEALFLSMMSKNDHERTLYLNLVKEKLNRINKLMADETTGEEIARSTFFEEKEDAYEEENNQTRAEENEDANASTDTFTSENDAESQPVDPEAAVSEPQQSETCIETEAIDVETDDETATETEQAPSHEPDQNVTIIEETPAVESTFVDDSSIHTTPADPVADPTVNPEPAGTSPERPDTIAQNRTVPNGTPANEVVRIEHKLATHTSRDIHKAFTLNDKFRYRRMLFGNNSAQYADALDLISQMDSYDEAADYFFSQYGWNPEDETVKSFMQIVKNHFNA